MVMSTEQCYSINTYLNLTIIFTTKMKKYCLSVVLLVALIFQFCATSKSAKSRRVPKVTYMTNIQPIIVTSCAPCHIPGKGNKKPYDTYAAVKEDVDEIIARVSKNPGEKGFMPQRHPKLSADTINTFVKWKADGLLETVATKK